MISLLLAVVMLMSLAVPAFAAEAASAGDVVFDDIISSYEPDDIVTQDVLDALYALAMGEETAESVDDEVATAEDTEPAADTDAEEASVDELVTFAEGNAEDTELAEGDTETQEPETPASAPVTQQDAVIFALRTTGMKDSQLSVEAFGTEQFAYDCVELAKSMDILPADYDGEANCTMAQLSALVNGAAPMYDALHAEKRAPLFMNGMAQPIFPYTSGIPAEGTTYSNDNSDIIRYCVYVETNYDTDGDGKLDLVKTFIQVPRAAVEGDYQAATIYEARPYISGLNSWYGRDIPSIEGGYDIDSMYSTPAARVPAGAVADTMETAKTATSDQWYYQYDYDHDTYYEDLTWYDYYLVRGFAVVECAGLGTKDSEGFETCGTDLEIDAFKCVIEWLHGDGMAYTDRENNIPIEADWSNGKVGMTGRSYAGTTQFGLANTGVAGLETIVPVAGIASWYDYTNSQGTNTQSVAYSDKLAWYCASRVYDADYVADTDGVKTGYGKYLKQIVDLQNELNGDYGEHWRIRDYTNGPLRPDWTGIHIPALIVHGLNDTNVRTKQSDMMYKAFTSAGQNVKMLLHWNGHLTPSYPAGGTEIKIGDGEGEYYDSILNRWFSHYLYGVNNGAENMAPVTAQNNVTGGWDTYDSWTTAYNKILKTSDVTEDETSSASGRTAATYTFEVPEDVTVKGAVTVHIRAKATGTDFENKDNVRITVDLKDKNATEYNAFMKTVQGSYCGNIIIRENGAWMGGGVENFDLVEYEMIPVTSKSIGQGYIDVFNPDAGYVSSTSTRRETKISEDTYYDYTVYIQPTLYTVKAGHTMELSVSVGGGMTLTVDNANTYIDIPTHNATSGGSAGGSTAVVTKPVETTATEKFVDVETTDWYSEAVDYVVDKGLMAGVSETSFGPSIDTTRGMIVTILYRLEKEPTVGTASFNDVASGQYYADAVAWASANGIVAGYGNGSFGPNDVITREQLVAILFRYAEYKGYDLTKRADLSAFLDQANISGYAVDAMSWANAMGLVNGVSDTLIAPSNSAVRAQVAMIFMNFCENVK